MKCQTEEFGEARIMWDIISYGLTRLLRYCSEAGFRETLLALLS